MNNSTITNGNINIIHSPNPMPMFRSSGLLRNFKAIVLGGVPVGVPMPPRLAATGIDRVKAMRPLPSGGNCLNTGVRNVSIMAAVAVLLTNIEKNPVISINPSSTFSLLVLTDSITGINSYTVALIPFAVFTITGVINKYDLEEINWSVIWMVAGGFALGYGLNASGLAENAVKSIPFGEFSPVLILLLSGILCYILSNFISNSATAALLMPILAVVCSAMGDKLDIIGGIPTILIGVAIASSSAMVLPISTPPNALAFSTNLVNQKDMTKIGLIVGIISMAVGYGVLYVLGKYHLI